MREKRRKILRIEENRRKKRDLPFLFDPHFERGGMRESLRDLTLDPTLNEIKPHGQVEVIIDWF